METIYNYIYEFLITYILPQETCVADWADILVYISLVVTLGIFWACLVRPFWWLFKYGLWGGSKKSKWLNKWDD